MIRQKDPQPLVWTHGRSRSTASHYPRMALTKASNQLKGSAMNSWYSWPLCVCAEFKNRWHLQTMLNPGYVYSVIPVLFSMGLLIISSNLITCEHSSWVAPHLVCMWQTLSDTPQQRAVCGQGCRCSQNHKTNTPFPTEGINVETYWMYIVYIHCGAPRPNCHCV